MLPASPTQRSHAASFVPTAVPVSHHHPCNGSIPVVALPVPPSANVAVGSVSNTHPHEVASDVAKVQDTKWEKQKIATVLPDPPPSHDLPSNGHNDCDALLASTTPYYRLPLPEAEMNIGAAAQHGSTAAGLRAATAAGKAAAEEERAVALAQREETVQRDDARRVTDANVTAARKAGMWDEGLTVEEWAHWGECNLGVEGRELGGGDVRQQQQTEGEADGKLRPYKQQPGKGGYEVNKYDVAEYETGEYDVAEYKSVYD